MAVEVEDAAVVVEEAVEVMCKLRQGEEYLGNIVLESGNEGLRCRFAWTARVEEVAASFDAHCKGVTCRGDPEELMKVSLESWQLVTLLCGLYVMSDAPKLIGNATTVTVVLPTGEELVCDPVCEPVNSSDQVKKNKPKPIYKRLSLLDRFLFVWILLVMVVAIVVGYNVQGVKQHLQVVQIASVSLPIAIGLWVMMFPVLCKVKYEILGSMLMSGQLTQTLIVSLVLNWLIGPALMTALAWAALPDLPGYRSGVILVGIARCIAMVLIWNDLANGDPELCAVLVALNSVLQIALYLPLALFYVKVLGGQGLHVGVWDVAKSVLLFLGVPLAAGILTRYTIFLIKGKAWFEKRFVPFISPWALIGLLYTIFVMFSIQAHQILSNIGDVFRVSVPLLAYFGIVFFSTVAICRALKMGYPEAVTQSFTASSNNFELAIAVAVGSFGIDSQQALAATIGPLIEVPVLLALVYVTLCFKKSLFKA